MRYTVERQWAVVDGHRGRVIEVYETEGDAYRAAYKKEASFSKRARIKAFQAQAAGWAVPLPEDHPESLAASPLQWPLDDARDNTGGIPVEI